MGFSSDTVAVGVQRSQWGNTANDYILDDVVCNGRETRITQCQQNRFQDDCSGREVAGVVCFAPKTIALIGGHHEGVVHVFGVPLATTNWGVSESAVVCNQLFGKSLGRNITPIITFRTTVNASQCIFSSISCLGTENGLHKCQLQVSSTCSSFTRIPYVACDKCNQSYLRTMLQNLNLQGNVNNQYQTIRGALVNLTSDCRNWTCSEVGKNPYPEFCKVLTFLKYAETLLQGSKEQNRKIVVLNTKINYGGMLKHQYLKETFLDLRNHISKLGNGVGDSQRKLSSYFANLAKFDQTKLNTDINALMKSWDEMSDALKVKNSLLKIRMRKLVNYAMKVNFYHKINLTTDLVLQTVSLLFTHISGISDIADRDFALRQTNVKLAKLRLQRKRLGNNLGNLATELQKIVSNIQAKTISNYENYRAVNTFFKAVKVHNFTSNKIKIFLGEYKKFDPAIDKIKLAELDETLTYVIENVCSTLKANASIAGNVTSGKEVAEDLCYRVKVTVKEIIEHYSNFVDYEIDLIKKFAELARSKMAEDGAKQLSKALKYAVNDKIVRLITQHKLFLLLQEKKRNLIKELCSYITYMNHGVEKPFCKSLINNPDSHVIDKLINYRTNVDMCANQVVGSETVVSIPVSSNSGNRNFSDEISGMLHLSDILEQGNGSYKTEGETVFQVPNEKWLMKNGWINSHFKGPFFIKKFEIFLPPSNTKYKYIVEADAMPLINKLGNVSYIFTKEPHVSLNYHENDGHILNCKDSLTPYYTDNCQQKVKPICVNRPGDFRGPLFPVATASWKLKIKSKVEHPLIFSTTRFYVKARIQLCHSKSHSFPKRSISEEPVQQLYQDPSACCSTMGQYYDQEILIAGDARNPCKPCPKHSVPRLNGFFCEKCPQDYKRSNKSFYGCECDTTYFNDANDTSLCRQ